MICALFLLPVAVNLERRRRFKMLSLATHPISSNAGGLVPTTAKRHRTPRIYRIITQIDSVPSSICISHRWIHPLQPTHLEHLQLRLRVHGTRVVQPRPARRKHTPSHQRTRLEMGRKEETHTPELSNFQPLQCTPRDDMASGMRISRDPPFFPRPFAQVALEHRRPRPTTSMLVLASASHAAARRDTTHHPITAHQYTLAGAQMRSMRLCMPR